MKFLFLTAVEDDNREHPIIVNAGKIEMVARCADGAHGCHLSLLHGILAVKEPFEQVSALLGDISTTPQHLM